MPAEEFKSVHHLEQKLFLQEDFVNLMSSRPIDTQMGRNLYKNARLGPIALVVQTSAGG
jgi:hypothetical protein